jgi:hypothetical protein
MHTTGFVHTRCALLRDDRASALYSRYSTGFCTFFSKVSRQVKTQCPHNPKIAVQHHPLHHADDLSPTRCSYRRIASAKHRSFLSIVLCRHHGWPQRRPLYTPGTRRLPPSLGRDQEQILLDHHPDPSIQGADINVTWSNRPRVEYDGRPYDCNGSLRSHHIFWGNVTGVLKRG